MFKAVKKFHLSAEQYLTVAHLLAMQTGYADRLVNGNRTAAQMVALLRDTINGDYCIYHAHGLSMLRPIHQVHHVIGRRIEGDYPRRCVSLCVECHDRVTRNMDHPKNDELQAIVDSLSVNYPRLLKLDYETHTEEDIQVYLDEYAMWML